MAWQWESPPKSQAKAKAKGKAKGGGKGKAQQQAKPSAQERAEQSAKDKRIHAAGLAAAKQKPARTHGKPAKTAAYAGSFRRILAVHGALPTTVPTRVERLTFVARFPLAAADAQLNPCVLFHPCRSVAHAVVFSPGYSASLGAAGRSGQTDVNTITNWVGGNFVGTTGTEALGTATARNGEAVGTPNALVSPTMRVVGGTCNVEVSCGPTAAGRLLVQVVTAHEVLETKASLLADLQVTSKRRGFRAMSFLPGRNLRYSGAAPLAAPGGLLDFDTANTQFSFSGGSGDPFGGILLAFDNVAFGSTDRPPIVTFSYDVSVECQLDLGIRHLATSHPTVSHEEKVASLTTEAPHIDPRAYGPP